MVHTVYDQTGDEALVNGTHCYYLSMHVRNPHFPQKQVCNDGKQGATGLTTHLRVLRTFWEEGPVSRASLL